MTDTQERRFDGTIWTFAHDLKDGRWVPRTPYAEAVIETQQKRGNPELAPWCEGSHK